MSRTSLLCLSSPEGDSNYYSALMNLKKPDDPKESFFQVIECFRICKNCMKKERVKAIQCTHVRNTAHWLSNRKIQELKHLYTASPEDAIREFGGIVISDYLPALRKEDIQKTFASPTETTLSSPAYIFTCCDPTGAGPSQLSIASGYYNNQGDVIVRASQSSLFCVFYFDMYKISATELNHSTRSTTLGSPKCMSCISATSVFSSLR